MEEGSPQKKEQSFFDAPPKFTFLFGLVGGVAVLSTIGLVITISLLMSNGSTGATATTNTSGAVAGTGTAPTPTNPAAPTAPANVTVAEVTDEDWIKGDPNAPVSIVEFSDTECPFCKQFHATMNTLIAEYDGQINWVYRHFPLASLHAKAPKEAEALECAGEQGGDESFWAYTDALYAETPSNDGLDHARLPEIAVEAGLDRGQFEECLESGKYKSKVDEQYASAVQAGGTGTPYSVIVADGQNIPVEGAYPIEQMRSILESVLNS